MKTKLLLLTILAMLCLWATADAPAVSPYEITDLGPVRDAGRAGTDAGVFVPTDVGAFALNDAGLVVGGSGHAFLWSGAKTEDLGTLPAAITGDSSYSIAYGINNRGQAVGASGGFEPILSTGLEAAQGFLYDEKGRLRQIPQGGDCFEPYAINGRGQIVGFDTFQGFLYENGRMTQLGTLSRVPAGNRSTARAISNSGQIVGWSTVNAGTVGPPYVETDGEVKRHGKWVMEMERRVPTRTFFTHACLWRVSGKTVRQRDLGTLPGWVNSYAYGINDRGEVTGSVADASGDTDGVSPDTTARAFFWRGGKMISLGTLPGSRSSESFGINNAGAVVGQSGGRAFLWQGGRMHDLNALLPAGAGWVLTEARAINNKGQIAGNGTFHGQPHAFLLTPR